MFVRAVVVMTLLVSSGCSFAWSRNARPPCTQYYVVPVIDVAIAATAAYEAIDLTTSSESNRTLLIGVGAAAAVAFTLSAVYGVRQLRRCETGT